MGKMRKITRYSAPKWGSYVLTGVKRDSSLTLAIFEDLAPTRVFNVSFYLLVRNGNFRAKEKNFFCQLFPACARRQFVRV